MREEDEGKALAVLAVDTGGTFTDVLYLDSGRLKSLKIPSTPADPAEAVLAGARALVSDGASYLLIHGSTVATNALLERKGARVILVTNEGFQDIIEIGRQNRPQLYALVGHRLPPLVARGDRIGIRGRLGPAGEEIEPVDQAELDGLPQRVAGAEALAVALLHSYANAEHERQVAKALAESGVPISVSAELLPEYREYERTSTTVVNAYVAPLMSRYLNRLDAEAGADRVRVMGSNGGAFPVTRAVNEPVHTVLSGPAGGVVGALTWAKRAGFDKVISFDMGGTSTDVSLCPGELLYTRELEIAGQPVAIPVIDIHTVGAGGGSIARLDPGGALRVGPRSAGADPGPICYGGGGTALTVTDAHVWLGRLPCEAFLGGEITLDRAAIEPHLDAIAHELGMSLEDAAEGILAVAVAAMERALRVISVERGFDPSEFTLVAFGGAGALHAAELAQRLQAARAVIPPDPGLLSAYGMLAAAVSREASRTVLLSTADEDYDSRVKVTLDDLTTRARSALLAEGVPEEAVDVGTWIDARYEGQSFELRVPSEDWQTTFHHAHEVRYGYSRPETPLEAVTLRAVATAPGAPLEVERIGASEGPPETTSASVHVGGRSVEAAQVERPLLRAGHLVEGPAIITEYSATTWVPEGWTARVDQLGNLILTD
ncbi:MAG: hydantoinase/oxoprolinase family protein [Gemmatimonadota bacterium]|nr:MAG: hydantoinase/oxoprolinase family protein [Gemmatimonadota bacterium]